MCTLKIRKQARIEAETAERYAELLERDPQAAIVQVTIVHKCTCMYTYIYIYIYIYFYDSQAAIVQVTTTILAKISDFHVHF